MSISNNQRTGGKVQVGDKAPDFTLLTQAGQQVSLSDFLGKIVVLYFISTRQFSGLHS